MHRLPGHQEADDGCTQARELGPADVDVQRDRPGGSEAIVGLHGDRGFACVVGVGREVDLAAVAGDASRAVGRPQQAPEQRVALEVLGHVGQAAHGLEVAVGLDAGLHRGRLHHRRLIRAPAVVGIEDLAIRCADAAVAVEVAQRRVAALHSLLEGRAVLAVDLAVVVQVAGHRDPHMGQRGVAGQAQQLGLRLRHTQQEDGLGAAGRAAEQRGAVDLQVKPAAAVQHFHGDHEGALRPRRLDRAGQFAIAHHETQIDRAGAERPAPGVGRTEPLPGHRCAEVGGDRVLHQAAVGAVAQQLAVAAAKQVAHQLQPTQAVVAVDGGAGVVGVGSRRSVDLLDAAVSVAQEVHALAAGAADQGHAGIADQPLLAIGEAHAGQPALRIQAVARAVGAGQPVAVRHPGQAGGLAVQPQALGLQRIGLHARRVGGGGGTQAGGLVAKDLQAPAGRRLRVGTEDRVQHARRARLGRQRLCLRAQREAEVEHRGLIGAQRCRHLQPDPRPVLPRRGGT